MASKAERHPISISRFVWSLMIGFFLIVGLAFIVVVSRSWGAREAVGLRLGLVRSRLESSSRDMVLAASKRENILRAVAAAFSADFDPEAFRSRPQAYLRERFDAASRELAPLLDDLPEGVRLYAAVDSEPAVAFNGFIAENWRGGGADFSPRSYPLAGNGRSGDAGAGPLASGRTAKGPLWVTEEAMGGPGGSAPPRLACAMPLAGAEGLAGAIALDFPGSEAAEALRSFSFLKTGILTLSDGEGRLFAHSPTSLPAVDLSRICLLDQGGSGKPGSPERKETRVLTLDGRPYCVSSIEPMGGWSLRLIASYSELIAPLAADGLNLLVFLGAAFLCTLAAAGIAVRVVSTPIRRLAKEAPRTFSEEAPPLPEDRGPLELRILAKSLNGSFMETRQKAGQQKLLMESDARIDLLTLDIGRQRLQSLNGFRLFGVDSGQGRDEMGFHEWVEHFHVRLLERDFNPLLSSNYRENRDQDLQAADIFQNLGGIKSGYTVQREIVFDTLKGEERFIRVNIVRVSSDTLLAACVDMTDEYHTRRDLFVLSTRLSYALNATLSVAIFDISMETMELWASESFFPIFEMDMPSAGVLILPNFEKRLSEGEPPLFDRDQGFVPSDFWRKGIRVFKLNLPRSRSIRWVEVRVAETVRGAIGTVIDITREVLEKQAALEKADSAQELSRVILTALTEAVFGMDRDGRCIFMNPAAAVLLGYGQSELVGRDLAPLFTMANADGSPDRGNAGLLERIFDGHQSVSNERGRFKRKDGSLFHATFRAQPIFKGSEFIGAVATLVDVSSLVELSSYFNAILANAVDHLYIKDQDLRMTMVSDSMLRSLGLAGRSEILGKTALDYLPREIAFEYFQAEKDVLESGKSLRDLVIKFPMQGEARWLNVSIIPLLDENGEIIGVFGIARDITDAYRLDDELRAAKEEADRANKAKSLFLAGMSHEIRTPLNAILGYSQLMEGDSGLSPEHRKKVATILRSGEHLLDLINSILEISKIEAGRVRPFLASTDLFRLLDDIEAMFRVRTEAKGLVFEVHRDQAVPRWILTDIQKLRQILINLLGNAVKFTDKGGMSLLVSRSGDKLSFEVRDSGPGISPEDRTRLFQPFEQGAAGVKAQGGTGLGLAISNEYAGLLGGGIQIDEVEAGQGSVFRCEIMLLESQAAQWQEGAASRIISGIEDPNLSPLVLEVDDSESNRLLVSDILQAMGFRVLQADNGKEALGLVSEKNPDIVLMDIAMPVMDGLEALSRIRSGAANSSVPVIAVTASAFEEDRRRVMAAGANDFIRKPIDRFELLEKIGAALKLKYKYAVPEGRNDPAAEGGGASYDLAAVPEGLRRELRKAAVELAPFQADEVIKAIGKVEAPLAARLAKLLARFDFQAIVALLDEKGENNG